MNDERQFLEKGKDLLSSRKFGVNFEIEICV